MDKSFQQINDNCNQLNENSLLIILKDLQLITDELKTEENRINLSNNNKKWIVVSKLLDCINNEIKVQNDLLLINNSFLSVIIQLFRLLRNSCIDCHQNQTSIVKIGSIFDDSVDVFKHILNCYHQLEYEKNNELVVKQLILSIKCCLQYFGNLISSPNNSDSAQDLNHIKDQVWKVFAFDLFRDLLEFSDDNGVCLIASMIFYNCISNSNIGYNLIELTDSQDMSKLLTVIELLLIQIANECSEWSLWSLQLMLKYKNFLHSFYSNFQVKSKLILLDIIYESTKENKAMTKTNLNELNDSNLAYLCALFKDSICDIVKIDSQTDNSSKHEDNKNIAIHTSKLLSILCELTTNQHYLSQLQTDRQLMECLVNTLKTIQLIGKTDSSSHFKSIQTLKQVNETDKEAENPVFGFKRDIIRVIANLVYKCTQMQDWAREMDGIPLILDCCNIDARNPYIMQWSIFAIRNLLENNTSNQQLISSLSRNGVLIDDQLMDKLGLRKDS